MMISLSEKVASIRLSSTEENIVVLLLYGWHSGSLIGFNSDIVTLVTHFTLTLKVF